MQSTSRKRIIILGAGGRDFHNFNTYFKDRREYEVIAFLATQIPNIDNRIYPSELSGPLYPNGIPIYPESMLEELVEKEQVDEVVLAYSDLLCSELLYKLSRILATGANFRILGIKDTMLKSKKPVIAVTAVRTGAGKSTISRRIIRILKDRGVKPVVIRHPMAYGNLLEMRVQRFSRIEDLDKMAFTIEEREEYELHLLEGTVVYAGVDYSAILEEVDKDCFDIIVWDGGNNDWPFIKPDLYITIVDPTRPGHEVSSYPGLVNLLQANVVVINKVDQADEKAIREIVERVKKVNPRARIVKTASKVWTDKPEHIKGRRVLVVEDGPSVTHGHMAYGAGYIAAMKYGAEEVVDPRPYAVGSIREVYKKYTHIGKVLPAMGYSGAQMRDLEESINNTPADVVILGTPTDISRYLKLNKPVVRVVYEAVEVEGSLEDIIDELLTNKRCCQK